MNHLSAAIAIGATLCALTTGCASPPAHFYTLNGTLSAGAAAPTGAAPPRAGTLAVAVGPVSIPAQVDRPQIVVSTGANQVRLDETHRWAAPLDETIARAVMANLIALLDTPQVTMFPQTGAANADYRVLIEVQTFASLPGEAATLDAVWTVRRTQDGYHETGRTRVREPVTGTDYAELAAAHSRALAALSRDIAQTLRTQRRSASARQTNATPAT